ncbi:unnamed protein product [Prunus armeniaca]|uniref:RNA 3'-terminal phosphate cyclase domain-containing protein n=1 Tax=Prunus armeniaca TaxID=36596 RepID=A0A6J5V141_PRUAR|nr:unnamed protein product [Prunus armeniaca]
MEKTRYKKLSGSQNLRQQLVLSTLTFTPIQIPDIRTNETWPGLRKYEVSLVKLLALVCHGCSFEINDTGTVFKFKPRIVMGRLKLEHDCGFERSIGYFLEPLILLGLFAKKPITITLKGLTNDSKDPSIDTFRSTTYTILKRFGVPSEGLELEIKSRGCAPKGGGEVVVAIPVVQSLTGVTWTDEGGWLRGLEVLHSQRECPCTLKIQWYMQLAESFIPSFPMFTYLLTIELAHKLEIDSEKKELVPPKDVGLKIASVLLGEIGQGGVVDSNLQGLLFLLCALCPQDVSKVQVGKLSPYGIDTLRNINDFLGVKFVTTPCSSTKLLLSMTVRSYQHIGGLVVQESKPKCSRMVRYSKYLFVWKGRIQFQASHGVFDDNGLDLRTSLFQPGEFDARESTKLSKIS